MQIMYYVAKLCSRFSKNRKEYMSEYFRKSGGTLEKAVISAQI